MAGGPAGSDILRLQNSFADLMLVVGLDENTGLIPEKSGVGIYNTYFFFIFLKVLQSVKIAVGRGRGGGFMMVNLAMFIILISEQLKY